MSNSLKFILIFIGSGAVMFLILFFYPAAVFDVKYVGTSGETAETVSLKAFLGWDENLKLELATKGIEIKRQLSGWMIVLIAFLGLPLMMAYRSTITKKDQPKEED